MARSPIPLILMVAITINGTIGLVLPKRTIDDNVPDNYDYYDYPGKYDEYPIVVTKRAALLLDRLMVALQKAVEDQGGSGGESIGTSVGAPVHQQSRSSLANTGTGHFASRDTGDTSMKNDKSSIDRRAQGKGRVYWRCYFNAVTCFKK